jgi:hypothetical protein
MSDGPAPLAKIETEIAPRTESLKARLEGLVVESYPEAEEASSLLATVQTGIREIRAMTRPVCDAAYAAHKAAVSHEKTLLDPWQKAETHLKRLIGDFHLAERRRQEEEQRRLEAEERKRQEAAAAEAAAQLERDGRTEEAEAVLQDAIDSPVVTVPPPPPPKVSGVAVRETWDFRIKDSARIARVFLVPDEKAIRALVIRLGPEAVPMLGGPAAVEVFRKTTVAGRR